MKLLYLLCMISIFCISGREIHYSKIKHLHEYRRRVLHNEADDWDHNIVLKNKEFFRPSLFKPEHNNET